MKNTLFYILGYFFVFIVFRFFRYGTRFAFDYNLISLDDIAIFLVVGVLLYFINLRVEQVSFYPMIQKII
jgi:hypothetical protein